MSKANLTKKRPHLWWLFILFSLLFHLPVLYLLGRWAGSETLPLEAIKPDPIRLRFSKPAEAQPAPLRQPLQIVDTSQPVKTPRKPTELIAPRESAADEEQIVAAVGPTRNAEEREQPAVEEEDLKKPVQDQEKQPKTPGFGKLVPDVGRLVQAEQSRQSNYLQRTEGPVTLLNARSSPYAQYFIDAGHRVVRYLDMNAELMSWYLQDFRRLQFPATVELVVTRDGIVERFVPVSRSGSNKIDQWFEQAVRSGFAGQIPPADILDASGRVLLVAQLHVDHIALGLP